MELPKEVLREQREARKVILGGLQVRGSGVKHDMLALEEEVMGLSSVAEG